MNTVVSTFKAFVNVVSHTPESDALEVQLVNLVSLLACMPNRRACVALVHSKNLNEYKALPYTIPFLKDYGVTLYKVWHQTRPAFFIYAELTDLLPEPFSSAQAMEIKPNDEPEEDWQVAA